MLCLDTDADSWGSGEFFALPPNLLAFCEPGKAAEGVA